MKMPNCGANGKDELGHYLAWGVEPYCAFTTKTLPGFYREKTLAVRLRAYHNADS
jgi:hypothetical protein